MARRVMPTCFVAAAVALVTAASASAVPSWLPPKDLSAPGGDVGDTQVAVDPQGDSFAVWRRFDGSHQIVQGSVRPAGGDWGAPQNLSALGFDSSKQHVAVDPNGNAVAVWYRSIGSNSQIEASTLSAGSTTWGPAEPVSDASGFAGDASIAIGDRGDAVITWAEFNGAHTFIQASRRVAGSTSWSTPKDLSSTSQNAQDARAAVDPLGNAVAVYQLLGAHVVIEGTTLPASVSDWTTPKDISDLTRDAQEPDVAVDSSGNATTVWALTDGSTRRVEGASLPAGGSTWTAPLPLSADTTISVNRQHIAIDGAGNAYVSWRFSNGTDSLIQASMRPPGGVWSMPQNLSAAGGNAFRPDIAVDAAGDSVVVFERSNGTNVIIQSAVRPAGATSWGAAKDLSAVGQDGHDPRVGVDATGDATAIWGRSNGSNQIAQAAGYDAAGPQLRSLSVPSSGNAFTPIAFSVAPVDVWSPVTSVGWSFGDGASSSGASVSHSFTGTGNFVTGVSATDSLGNSSSTQHTIALTLPAPTLGGVGQSARVWREGTRLPSFSRKKAPKGTTFRFTLNEPAKVSFVFQRVVTGRKSGRRCVAVTPRNKGGRKCTRRVVAGRLSHAAKVGANKLKFQGRLSRKKKLKLGRYVAIVTATNANGQRSAPKRLSFRIVAG
jgi:PKD domain